MTTPGTIRVGVGGWTFAPWRDNFYPAGLPHARELEYASRRLSAIEVNGTFYRLQTAATFAKWRAETPEDFVFTLKAPRYVTHRRVLAEAGESMARFFDSGIVELGPKLGPIVWQFEPHKQFDAADLEAFLHLLPKQRDGLELRHALDVRHASFANADYLALARRFGVTTVFTDSDDHPALPDLTGDFVYCRIMRHDAKLPDGCAPQVLEQLADCARAWRDGHEPSGLPRIGAAGPTSPPGRPKGEYLSAQRGGVLMSAPRDVFMFFISGDKEVAPAAAMALRRRVDALPAP